MASQSAGWVEWPSERFRVDTAKKKTRAGLGRLSRYLFWGAPERTGLVSGGETKISGSLRVPVERFFDPRYGFTIFEA